MATPLLSENFADLLEPGLRKVYVDTFKQIPVKREQIFNVLGSSRSFEQDTAVGGLGDIPAFNGTIQYDDLFQGYDKTYTHDEFAGGIQIERKLVDDDLYNIIKRRPQALAISVARTREKAGASVFVNAFSGSHLGGDAKALCATDHPTTAGTDTFGNKGTTALSSTSLEATRQLMRAFTDDRNELVSVQPSAIIVPPELEETAWVAINSEGKPGTADNDGNFQKGRYKVIVWDYLTNAKDWFMVDEAMMKLFLVWYDRIKPEFAKDQSFDTMVAKFRVYMRYSYGFSDWRWIYGHDVA